MTYLPTASCAESQLREGKLLQNSRICNQNVLIVIFDHFSVSTDSTCAKSKKKIKQKSCILTFLNDNII